MTGERIVPLSGVNNLRDYGGYRGAGGGAVRRGVLWRSGQHGGAKASNSRAFFTASNG